MIKRFALLSCAVLGLAACSAAQITSAASTPAGALFCAIQTAGGGAMVVSVVDAEASAAAPTAAPIAVIATGAAKSFVDNVCAAAGPGGIAVSPPANPAAAPQVAVVVPKSS